MSLDTLCRWQVQVSVYCARQIPGHITCTQCKSCCTLSISASYGVFACGRYCQSNLDLSRHCRFYEEQCKLSNGSAWPACQIYRAPIAGGIDIIGKAIFQKHCDSSTACRLCRFEPGCCCLHTPCVMGGVHAILPPHIHMDSLF